MTGLKSGILHHLGLRKKDDKIKHSLQNGRYKDTRTGLKVSEKQPTSKEKPERPSENLETQSPESKRRRGTRDFCTALCAELWIIWMCCRYVWKQWQVPSCFIILLPLQTSNLVSGALKAAHELCANITLCLTVKQKDKQRAAQQSPYNPDQTRCV